MSAVDYSIVTYDHRATHPLKPEESIELQAQLNSDEHTVQQGAITRIQNLGRQYLYSKPGIGTDQCIRLLRGEVLSPERHHRVLNVEVCMLRVLAALKCGDTRSADHFLSLLSKEIFPMPVELTQTPTPVEVHIDETEYADRYIELIRTRARCIEDPYRQAIYLIEYADYEGIFQILDEAFSSESLDPNKKAPILLLAVKLFEQGDGGELFELHDLVSTAIQLDEMDDEFIRELSLCKTRLTTLAQNTLRERYRAAISQITGSGQDSIDEGSVSELLEIVEHYERVTGRPQSNFIERIQEETRRENSDGLALFEELDLYNTAEHDYQSGLFEEAMKKVCTGFRNKMYSAEERAEFVLLEYQIYKKAPNPNPLRLFYHLVVAYKQTESNYNTHRKVNLCLKWVTNEARDFLIKQFLNAETDETRADLSRKFDRVNQIATKIIRDPGLFQMFGPTLFGPIEDYLPSENFPTKRSASTDETGEESEDTLREIPCDVGADPNRVAKRRKRDQGDTPFRALQKGVSSSAPI